MKLIITQQALQHFKDNWDLEPGAEVGFMGRYGGCSPIQQGFSLGITVESPLSPIVTTEMDGITFYVNEKDEWYFDGHDLEVDFDADKQELIYNYL